MATSDLPEGWYTDTTDGEAHHAFELIGSAVRPVCRKHETLSQDIRAPEVGDKICNACLTELFEGGAPITFPSRLGQCLGCQHLQMVVDPGLIAPHDVAGSTTQHCMGSWLRPARHDGRDKVRSEAVAKRVARQDEINDLRHALSSAIDRGIALRALTETITLIVHREAEEEFWHDLIYGGDYLRTAGYALRIIAQHHDGSDNRNAQNELRRIGARGWLSENRLHVQHAAKDSPNAAGLVDAVLETL
jgi:hypothetical protein